MRLWLTWEIQRRNRTVSAQVNADLHELNVKAHWIIRYIICAVKSLALLLKLRPSILFAQSPSIVLAALAVSWGRLFNIPVVIDAHNGGLFPFNGRKWWANKLVKYTIGNAALVLVHNRRLEKHIELNHGRAFVLPDPIPEFSTGSDRIALMGTYNVIFICTYSDDEPYTEVLKAAGKLDNDICVYVTGDSKGREKEWKAIMSPNVILTGFLSEWEYIKLLHSADIVMALTTREDCLLCGAYEGVGTAKPLIVSNTEVLKEYFPKGTLYVNNESSDIASKIYLAIRDLEPLGKESAELKREKIEQWHERKTMLENILSHLEADHSQSVRLHN